MCKTPEYRAWKRMYQSCINSNLPHYHRYGGRGIRVCDRWREENGRGFLNFLEDMGPRPGKEYSLDRMNSDDNYYKENCRWILKKEQSRNIRTNKIKNLEEANQIREEYSIGNVTQYQLAKKYNCSSTCINQILKNKTWKND